jgi:hypothetical protein
MRSILSPAGAPVRSKPASESAGVKRRELPPTAAAAVVLRPTSMPAAPSSPSAATKPASRASADTEIQEHPFEGGGPFVLTGGRLAYAAESSDCTGRTSDRSCWRSHSS